MRTPTCDKKFYRLFGARATGRMQVAPLRRQKFGGPFVTARRKPWTLPELARMGGCSSSSWARRRN